jgi:NifU-like protein involved in Fe-S cluster formation
MVQKKRQKVKKDKVIDIKKGERAWLYSQIVKEHFLNPKNVLWDEKNYQFDGKGVAGNPVCGDRMALWIKVDPKTQKIKDCKWRTYGCGAAIASTSMLSVMVTEKGGMPLKKALNLKPQEIVERLGGLPALKFHCSVLGQAALKEAINDYLKKQKRKK